MHYHIGSLLPVNLLLPERRGDWGRGRGGHCLLLVGAGGVWGTGWALPAWECTVGGERWGKREEGLSGPFAVGGEGTMPGRGRDKGMRTTGRRLDGFSVAPHAQPFLFFPFYSSLPSLSYTPRDGHRRPLQAANAAAVDSRAPVTVRGGGARENAARGRCGGGQRITIAIDRA